MRSTFDRRTSPAGETVLTPPSPHITPVGTPTSITPTPPTFDCSIPTNWDNPECAVFVSSLTADQKHNMLLAYVRRYFGRDDVGSLTDEQYMMILRLPKDPIDDPNNQSNTLNRLTGYAGSRPTQTPTPTMPTQPTQPPAPAPAASASNRFFVGLVVGAVGAWFLSRSK